jgi:hypothetical protein
MRRAATVGRRLPSSRVLGVNPLTILGSLAFWTRGDLGRTANGGATAGRADQSGNGRHFSQGTPGSQPLFVASGSLNGCPCDRYDGTDDYLENTTWTFSGAATVFIVYKLNVNAGAGQSVLTLANDPTSWSELLVDLNTYRETSFAHDFSSVASVGHDAVIGTSAHVHMHTWDGSGTYTASLDGVTQSVVGSGTFARGAGVKASIGARGGPSFPTSMDLYEIAVSVGVQSAAKQSALYNYARQRYGL